jgi:aminoglycoside phosphotransferase (APT) family kinase protein
MNPDTKLTDQQIRAICYKHNIEYLSHSRITTGFTHEVHRLNKDLVIKIFNTKDFGRYKTELALLASELTFPKPKLVANDDGKTIERAYIIMSFVSGNSLGSVWHIANDTQRESLIQEISKALRIINKLDPQVVAGTSPETWVTYIQGRSRELVKKLLDNKIITEENAQKTLHAIERNSVSLNNSKLHAVYWDIHFDNFIVNDNFELQVIIDLENVELTSLDYPLFVIQKMTDEPEKYLREEGEKYANLSDYKHLISWYQKYYPEMFDFENLGTRVKIYQLLDTLHLLKEWSHVKSLYVKLNQLLIGLQ